MRANFTTEEKFKKFLTPDGYIKKDKIYTNFYNYDNVAGFPHSHTFWEMFLVLDGSAAHQWNYHAQTIRQGDLILIKPGESHYLHQLTGSYYDLYVDPPLFQSVCDLVHPHLYSFMSSIGDCWLHLDDQQRSFYQTLLKKLYEIQESTDRAQINTVYLPLISAFVGLFAEKYFLGQSEENLQFYEFLATINTKEYVCGTLDQIVEASHYSHGYLCKIFKERMGKTLKNYHNEMKMNYAVELLRDNNLSILDISNILGYSSLSNFIQLFKGFSSETPKQYRKIFLNL
jgi:AraC family cel operon transcriptional repressor